MNSAVQVGVRPFRSPRVRFRIGTVKVLKSAWSAHAEDVAMHQDEIVELLNNVVLEYPCPVKWQSMDGDDRVRFCSECKLHVHNLSNMPAPDAAEVLVRRKA